MATFPSTLSDLQTYIGNLINDSSFQRYSLTLINSQLDLAQHRWNMEAKICRFTDNVALTANTYRYVLSTSLTLTPIMLMRVTHMGIALTIRSKQYFDQYSAVDWTTIQGTPRNIALDINTTSPALLLQPTPQSADVALYSNAVGITNQNPLGVEYLCPHTPMVNSTDTPFIVNGVANALINPYLAGLGLDVAASLLEPDPTKETIEKARLFRAQANNYLSLVVQVYQGLEEDIPGRMVGGRNWNMGIGNVIQSK